MSGTVLIVPETVGSAGPWRFLYQLYMHKTTPAAIIAQVLPDSSLVQGAILAGIPIVCGPEADLFALVEDRQSVTVDGTDGTISL